jgi:hypothetical protein
MDKRTDLEMCFDIAKLQGYLPSIKQDATYPDWVDSNENILHGQLNTLGEFNPFKDKALCFDLMMEHGIIVKKSTARAIELGKPKFKAEYENITLGNIEIVYSDTPQRAIVLALMKKYASKMPLKSTMRTGTNVSGDKVNIGKAKKRISDRNERIERKGSTKG